MIGSAEQHDPFREFFEIEEPGRVFVHSVLSGNGERDTAEVPPVCSTRMHDNSAAPQVSSTPRPAPTVPAEPITHNATWDLCDSRVRGDRYYYKA